MLNVPLDPGDGPGANSTDLGTPDLPASRLWVFDRHIGYPTIISGPPSKPASNGLQTVVKFQQVLAQRYELVDARLSAAGMTWYEVSNWSRPGGECRHNLGYWDGGQWWGAGPGAHGYVGATRWWNVKHPNAYAEMLAGSTLPVAGFEQLDAEALHTEDVLLKTRMRQGLPLAGLGASERERAKVVVADGLLVADGDRLVLTPRGRLLADAVVRTLLG